MILSLGSHAAAAVVAAWPDIFQGFGCATVGVDGDEVEKCMGPMGLYVFKCRGQVLEIAKRKDGQTGV